MQDQFSGIDVQEDQLLEVLRHLDENPPKVTLTREDGSHSNWMDKAIAAEARRSALREAETRLAHELMDEEEQQELRDRVRRLKRQLGVA